VRTDFGSGDDEIKAMTVQPDGKIVAVGYASNGANNDFAVVRYNADGTIDTSFATSGKLTINRGGDDELFGVTLQQNNKIVAVGQDHTSSTGNLVTIRLTTAGAMDTTFNSTGTVATDWNNSNIADDTAKSVVIRPGGAILVGGNTNYPAYGSNYDFALEQFSAGASGSIADYSGGTADWTNGSNMFGACLRAVSGSGAAGVWTINGGNTCPGTSGAYWNPIPATNAAAGAKVAQDLTPGITNATAQLRFGFRASNTQAPGVYAAPITFEVDAPAV
jgi:uncharacterized delta-60 repeat protein